jgi:prepilin-type N-terminal cleavage/methylation domain-containing protein
MRRRLRAQYSSCHVHIRRSSAGFTLVELLVVMAIVALLASVAIAGYRQSKIRASEASTLSALRSINQAQFVYMQSCGNQRYAPTLTALGTAAPGGDHPFVSPDLAASDPLEKSGYVIHMTGTAATEGEQTCTGAVPLTTYRITADPVTPGISGNQYYGTNSDRVIYSDLQTFYDNMPETGPPGHGQELK